MKEPMVIRFSGAFEFLSNFYESEVEYEGLVYPTAEHAFQAAKTLHPGTRKLIRDLPTPGQAKRMGRHVLLRPLWENVKIDVMHQIVKKKFENPEMRKLLLKTNDRKLIEGNYWGDTFWGVCDGEGSNHLGKILMRVREEIRADDG
jgi:ribA/ribD-fused uncharacterized protein